MRALRPRLSSSDLRRYDSFERLILAEVADRQAQGIDRNQFIRNARLKDENEICGIEIALQLAMIGRRVINQVKVHPRAIGGILQVFKRDLLYVDIDFGCRGIGEEFANDIVFTVGVENAVGELAVQEVERLREFI